MTSVTVFRCGGRVERVTAKGHTGYARSGKDIVCAAVSAVLETTLIGLKRAAEIEVVSKRGDGYLEFEIPFGQNDHDAQVILETMLLGIKDLAAGHSRYIGLEVKEL